MNILENESYRAWQSKDTKFWPTFLSDRFVSWDASGRIGKATALREWSGTNCSIASYRISDSQVSRLTPGAAVITHKTMVDGSCSGKRIPKASWTATAYVLRGTQWKAVFRAASPIVDPTDLPRQADDAISADRTDSHDANTEAMLSSEQALWSAWKNRDVNRLDALLPREVQFINIFGTHLGTRLEALSAWSGRGCDVKSLLMPTQQFLRRTLESSPCVPQWMEPVLVSP